MEINPTIDWWGKRWKTLDSWFVLVASLDEFLSLVREMTSQWHHRFSLFGESLFLYIFKCESLASRSTGIIPAVAAKCESWMGYVGVFVDLLVRFIWQANKDNNEKSKLEDRSRGNWKTFNFMYVVASIKGENTNLFDWKCRGIILDILCPPNLRVWFSVQFTK